MNDVYAVKVTDLSTMERETWEHIMKAAKGPHNAVNAQYAIAFALMSQSDTMATQCKVLDNIETALSLISQALADGESDGVAHVKMGLNDIADAIRTLAKDSDDLIG